MFFPFRVRGSECSGMLLFEAGMVHVPTSGRSGPHPNQLPVWLPFWWPERVRLSKSASQPCSGAAPPRFPRQSHYSFAFLVHGVMLQVRLLFACSPYLVTFRSIIRVVLTCERNRLERLSSRGSDHPNVARRIAMAVAQEFGHEPVTLIVFGDTRVAARGKVTGAASQSSCCTVH